MRTALAIAMAIAAFGGAHGSMAQDGGGSAYCSAGSIAMLQDSTDKEIGEVRAKCRPGDTIRIPGGRGGDMAVARVCDFSKAIANAGGMVICVVAAPRAIRKST
ncbi:MAG: hypothetical protein WDO24_05965 [Pseudomonadota bacterium]